MCSMGIIEMTSEVAVITIMRTFLERQHSSFRAIWYTPDIPAFLAIRCNRQCNRTKLQMTGIITCVLQPGSILGHLHLRCPSIKQRRSQWILYGTPVRVLRYRNCDHSPQCMVFINQHRLEIPTCGQLTLLNVPLAAVAVVALAPVRYFF